MHKTKKTVALIISVIIAYFDAQLFDLLDGVIKCTNKQFSEIVSFRWHITSEKRCQFFIVSNHDVIIAVTSLDVTTNDSFDDGFKHESLILAQNERWRQA